MATISFGPNLGLLNNAAINQKYYDQLRLALQALGQLIMGRVINATQASPPSSPANGDSYLLTGGTPSGSWTGQAGNIAVWDTQVTLTGTNTLSPAWVFYTPQPGWIIWNVALANLYVYTGSAWALVTSPGGANFPTNTDITSMTGLTNQTLTSSGYIFNNGTAAETTTIGATGWQYGGGTFGDSATNDVFVSNQNWGSYSGIAVVVQSSTEATIIGAGVIDTGNINCQAILADSVISAAGTLRVGDGGSQTTPGVIQSYAGNQGLVIGPQGSTYSNQTAVTFLPGVTSPTSGVGLIGFGANYATQTTVGAAGAASALPATPKKYIQITDTDGSIVVFPVYAHV